MPSALLHHGDTCTTGGALDGGGGGTRPELRRVLQPQWLQSTPGRTKVRSAPFVLSLSHPSPNRVHVLRIMCIPSCVPPALAMQSLSFSLFSFRFLSFSLKVATGERKGSASVSFFIPSLWFSASRLLLLSLLLLQCVGQCECVVILCCARQCNGPEPIYQSQPSMPPYLRRSCVR